MINEICGYFKPNGYHADKINIKRIINDKKVTDHHAIIPTMTMTKDKLEISEDEKNILFLTAYRLLSAVYMPHVYAASKAVLEIEGEAFTATGREIIEPSYKIIEQQMKGMITAPKQEKDDKDEDENGVLPKIEAGDILPVTKLTSEEKKTPPPKPYTEDTLLSAMETAGKNISDTELKEAMNGSGLGTPATRAAIIENIIKTGYIRRDGKKLIANNKAYTFIDLVGEAVKSPELTAMWEKQLAEIQRGETSETDFMEQMKSFIRTFVDETKATCTPASFKAERTAIGTCPICGKKS